jgi:hypothetical protein
MSRHFVSLVPSELARPLVRWLRFAGGVPTRHSLAALRYGKAELPTRVLGLASLNAESLRKPARQQGLNTGRRSRRIVLAKSEFASTTSVRKAQANNDLLTLRMVEGPVHQRDIAILHDCPQGPRGRPLRSRIGRSKSAVFLSLEQPCGLQCHQPYRRNKSLPPSLPMQNRNFEGLTPNLM